MKLPISLLVLAALGHAASLQSTAKGSGAKSSVTKQKDNNQTNKRELYEGNYGERNKELLSKYAVSGPSPKIEYAKELKEMITDQSPAHQIFGVRLPQIAKISDVLSGQGPSFEAAVAKHLYSPISVYHARLSSPTSFEVPMPAASQLAYPNPKTYKIHKAKENYQKLQEVPPKGVELPGIPLYTVKQPKLRFESYPQPLDSGFSRQHSNLPQEIFRPQQLPRQPVSPLFPLYDQLEPIRYQGHVLPSQYLQQNRVYQFLPINPGFDYGNQEDSRGKDYTNQDNPEELKAEPSERPKVQNEIPVPKQGYHAHPNGAISFASFSHNVPINTQYETLPQSQSENFNQQLPQEILQQHQPEAAQLQTQEQKLAPVKQKLQYSPSLQKIVQDLQKYQPDYQPQFITFKQQIQNEPRALNVLQQHLLFQDPRQLPHPQVIQLQRLPAFKPLPQSLLTPESFFQQTSPSPLIAKPRPFSYDERSTQSPSHIDQPIAPVSPQRQYTPLPPLKPNYSRHVKPLKPRSRTTSVFLPTPLQPLPTSTPKVEPVPDQLISSTTIQPDVKDNEKPKEESIEIETQPQSETSQQLEPEITHQSQPTASPVSIQSTTYQTFATPDAESDYLQNSTPQPEYQSTIRPHSIRTSPRHDVVIQRQEIQELIFEPSLQPSSTPHYQQQQQQQTQIGHQQEQEVHQLQSQEHHQLFEQLQPLQFQQELQELHSQQYRLEARHLHPQKQYATQQIEPQQYQYQQHSHPHQHHQLQLKQLHSQQLGLEHSQQHQQQLDLKHSQQQQLELEHSQQQHLDRQQHQLEPKNEIQVSTLKPSQELEKQTEQVEIKHEADSEHQLQHLSKLQPTTGKPEKQTEKLSEPTSNSEQPYFGSILSPIQSVLPQIYGQPQQLVGQSEYGSLLGVPTVYPDVQYFGKFAEALFGNHQ